MARLAQLRLESAEAAVQCRDVAGGARTGGRLAWIVRAPSLARGGGGAGL